MNLKYYLRGLGIGIVVTALIMGITAGRKEPMSDAQIKERAKALGMVEEEDTHLIDLPKAASEPENAEKDEELPENDSMKETLPEEVLAEPESTPGEPEEAWAEPENTPAESEKTQGEPENQDNETADLAADAGQSQAAAGGMVLQISSGDGSYAVCKKLQEAGLIESASEYDVFLYQNGYDKKIRAGMFEIPIGAGEEEIAKIICGIG